MENLNRCGGYAIQYRQVKALAEAQGTVVLRANAYMAINHEREGLDLEYRQKKDDYRNRVRREGFHLVLKEVQHYRDAEGQVVTKADADLELAVDALLQTENLDYVMLGTGDGDFLRLVRALQNRGKRVDLLSFMNTSTKLRQEVDNHFSGYLIPNLLPEDRGEPERLRGITHAVNEEKGYAFPHGADRDGAGQYSRGYLPAYHRPAHGRGRSGEQYDFRPVQNAGHHRRI